MTTALYAGSFDPITLGHIDILNTASSIFNKVIIAVAYNPEKQCFLPVEARVKLIKECLPNNEVYSYDGLTVDFAKQHGASVLIRGIRNSGDFEYENKLALINSKLAKDIKTVFLTSSPEYSFISSSVVRELLLHKQDLSNFVPQNVAEFLYRIDFHQNLSIKNKDA